MSEIISEPEIIDEEYLAHLLRSKGPEDDETREMLIRWTEQQEAIADADPENGRIQFELNRAHLYLSAGLMSDARVAFEDAYTLAYQSGKNVIADIIKNEMQGLSAMN